MFKNFPFLPSQVDTWLNFSRVRGDHNLDGVHPFDTPYLTQLPQGSSVSLTQPRSKNYGSRINLSGSGNIRTSLSLCSVFLSCKRIRNIADVVVGKTLITRMLQ